MNPVEGQETIGSRATESPDISPVPAQLTLDQPVCLHPLPRERTMG